MIWRLTSLASLACALCFACIGCKAPGKPVQIEAARPDDVVDFPTLYKQNCAACHGEDGKSGATISLANPVYVTAAGAGNIERVTALGVAGTAMPAFAKSAGGMLIDRQIAAIAKGNHRYVGTRRPNGDSDAPSLFNNRARRSHQGASILCDILCPLSRR